ncbi:Fpg/Nei family DNA glycosylase [Aquibacillus salsiterrae]|uniref:Formamidopyrimidine-DNA glycosylase n=1 Tax=Aquibacillus salsiterrae TaxID=2950439 RepID=A0A9X4AFP3_9BACI|nr:DNA-formamidopyrimidine glycosylase family protein [Aquibacillus salsiterrae]MDC3416228.1 endonuclease VIII [Aquibacillus salsiterrae]
MPELPEMENYKRLLHELIKGKEITDVEINREKSINMKTEEFIDRVKHQTIESIERRAKHLLFNLKNGETLLLHLMLGGWMFYGSEHDKPDRTVQVRLEFGDNSLHFIGLRLGYLHLLKKAELKDELDDLGPEPLDINFSLDAFLAKLVEKRGVLKTSLVDQHFLAGIGNRYSDEICWDAKFLPTKKVADLVDQERIQFYHSIKAVLERAVNLGGYMDEPLYKGDNKTGGFLNHFNVYKLEGNPCKRCGNTIIRDEISSRKSFYCTECQS